MDQKRSFLHHPSRYAMRVLSLVTISGIYFVTITVTLSDAPVGAETVSLRGCASVMAKRGDFMRCPWGDSGLLCFAPQAR
jgi:hypothetical protein